MKTTTDLLDELDSTSADVHGRVKQAKEAADHGNYKSARAQMEIIKQRHKTCVALCDAALRDIKECLVDEKGTARTPAERTATLPFAVPDGVDSVTIRRGKKS